MCIGQLRWLTYYPCAKNFGVGTKRTLRQRIASISGNFHDLFPCARLSCRWFQRWFRQTKVLPWWLRFEKMGNVSYTSSLIHVSMLEPKWADHHSTRKEPFPKRMEESSSIVELGFHQIIQSRNIYTIFYIRICETLWNIKSAQRAMETSWNIYVQASNVDNRKLHNRKATPQFAVINCAFILLWYSFPHRPRMG